MAFQKGRLKTGGRKRGSLNKATFEIQQTCREHGPAMIVRLVQLVNNPDGHVAIGAIKLLLAYAYGRPCAGVELTGAEDSPPEPQVLFYIPSKERHANPP